MRRAVWSAGSGLLDIPHEQGRGDDDALEVFPVGSHRRPLPGRYVRQSFVSARLDLDGHLLTRLTVGGLQPFRPQGFELLVIGPTKPGRTTIRRQRQIAGRIERLDTRPAGAENAPTTLLDRLFRRASDHQ